jgi:HPt (histidine-containing phosphotransfer) domain-containing protein
MFVEEEIWMQYLAGNKDLFKVVAKAFIEDYKNYHNDIIINIKEHNVDELHNMLHSLKGITLNLGMKKLYDQSENTLIPIRKNLIDQNEFDKLLNIFDQSYDELKNILG